MAQKYLSTLSATKAATARKIIDYVSYRYRIGEYTAQFTYAEIASHIGVCTKTIQRYIHELIKYGLLAVVKAGRSAAFSPTEQNEAPIYTLLIPSEEENVHPLSSLKKSVKSLKDNKKNFLLTQVPVSRTERVIACEELKMRVIDLRKVPTFLLVKHLKKTFSTGWCLKDVIEALEKNPEGQVYLTRGAGGMRSPLAWLHIRLNAWKTDEGLLLPSPTRIRYEEQIKARAEAVKRQQEIVQRLAEPVMVPTAGLEKMRLMREFLKVRERYGAARAARLYPEQAELVDN
ncbi:helix-turn-helix domain-containing protein [Rothia terrae]|uniref:helix-turn-helix domain-containing protein n=1 Tax=Rothia terrae TaxID=396015 RepID=UPI0033ECDEE9